jgi:hypothetical protein
MDVKDRVRAQGGSALVRCAFWLGVMVLCGALPTARAYDGRTSMEWDVGYSGISSTAGYGAHGVATGLSVGRGVSPEWTLRGRIGYALHPATDDGSSRSQPRATQLWAASADALYLIDIVTWVPYFGAGMDALVLHQDTTALQGAVHGVLGVDYFLDFDWLLGAEFRPYLVWSDLDATPAYWNATLHVTYLF